MIEETNLIEKSNQEFKNFVDLLEYRFNLQPEDIAFTYISDDSKTQISLTYRDLIIKVKAIAYDLQRNNFYGKRALLLYTPGLDFITAFLACLYAGVIAVPAYPPEINRMEYTLKRIEKIIIDSDSDIVLTTAELYKITEKIILNVDSKKIQSLHWLQSDKVDEQLHQDWYYPEIDQNTIAFLQYTSGSTSEPKGVIITHKNLLSNQKMIKIALGHEERKNDVACWVPFYHDMGLIGHLLQSLYIGSKTIIISPMAFLRDPYRWLKIISENNISSTGAPNFAYDLCVKKVSKEQLKSLNLSHLINASNGGEPLKKETLERFSEYFKETGFTPDKHKPLYGMAEATVFIASPLNGTDPEYITIEKKELEKNKIVLANENSDKSITFVSCGQSRLGEKIIIVNPDTKEISKPDEVGEIWISGDHISQGYWNLPELTRYAFENYVLEVTDKPFLRTGDLGLIFNDNLYITGRIKDLIIINGRNLYPQDIEKDIEALKRKYRFIRPGCNAVFSNENSDKIVLFQEIDKVNSSDNSINFDLLTKDILEIISKNHNLAVESIVFLETGSIAKTSSGKIMRQPCKKAYLSDFNQGYFKIIYKWDGVSTNSHSLKGISNSNTTEKKETNKIKSWLINWLAKELGINETDTSKNFAYYGLNSALSVLLVKELEDFLNIKLYSTILWDYNTIDSLSDYLADKYSERLSANQSLKENELLTSQDNDIAIIGVSCNFPGEADSPQIFWNNLEKNIDGIIDIPKERWNNDEVLRSGLSYAKQGGFINDIDLFDPEFFSISQKEAIGTDPQQRILLELSWQALENAGILPYSLKDSNTGVFIGISTNDYAKADINSGDNSLIDQYSGIGNAMSVAAGRISYTFGFQGPSISMDTACSSSLVSTHLACQSLLAGESDLALAGGINLILSSDINIYFSKINALSVDDRCKTFDDNANGYVRSEGGGIIVLKRLKEAINDKNNILAVIKASGINHDGKSNGLTAPNGKSQEKLLAKVLEKSGLKARDIGYLEAHGTGTNLGDPIELRSINQVYLKNIVGDNPLIIGSVKSNIGHLEAGAGVAGLIKVLLAMQKNIIPANLHFKQLNKNIDPQIEINSFKILQENSSWNNQNKIASISSFGISGTNANLILQSYGQNEKNIHPRSVNILTISAINKESLFKNISKYLEFIEKSHISLDDISYTASRLRTHFQFRESYCFENKEDLIYQLNESLESLKENKQNFKQTKKIAFVYPGHGSQWLDMGKNLWEKEAVFKNTLLEINEIFKEFNSWSLIDFLTNNQDEEKLNDVGIIQPVIFALQIAISKLLIYYGIKPDGVIGHSMGEVAAAYIAGIIDLQTAAKIICQRSKLMQTKDGQGLMLFVNMSYDECLKLIENKDNLSIAVSNGNQSTVLSGDTEIIKELQKELDLRQIFNRLININMASHSYQMNDLKDQLIKKIGTINHQKSHTDFYSSTYGQKINLEELDNNYWGKNLRETVRFDQAFETAINDQFYFFIEISPHSVLSIIMQNTLKEMDNPAQVSGTLIKNKNEYFEINRVISKSYNLGIEINWENIYPQGNLVNLPNYQWNKKRYWKEIKPSFKNNISLVENHVADTNIQEKIFEVPTNPKDWLYEIQYENKEIERNNQITKNSFLIFADNFGICDNLKIILDAQKCNYVLVYPAGNYKKIDNKNYQINYKDIKDYQELFNQINIANFNKIVHLWILEQEVEVKLIKNPQIKEVKQINEKGILSIINIIKLLDPKQNKRIYAITNNSLYINGDPIINYNQSPLWGLGKVANYELPELKFTNIDLNSNLDKVEISLLFEELNNDSKESIVALRSENRLVPRIDKYLGLTKIEYGNSENEKTGFWNKLLAKPNKKKYIKKEVPKPQIDSQSTYLIVGGTGGLGILFTKYLIDNGAKSIVLCSRNGPDEKTLKEIEILKKSAEINIFKTDIADPDQVKKLFDNINSLPLPLGGIIHSALVLNDSSIKSHEIDYFNKVMNPKVSGLINLHNYSIDHNLSFFIAFSSLTSIFGMKYFTNYSAANSFLDSFSYYRRKLGLPSITINWGAWSEAGQAVYHKENKDLDLIGMTDINPEMGIRIFGEILKINPVQIIVMNTDMKKFSDYYPTALNIKMYERLFKAQNIDYEIKRKEFTNSKIENKSVNISESNNVIENINKPKIRILENLNSDQKSAKIKELIKKEISLITNLPPEKIDNKEHFRNYGFDSLMAIEMINNLSDKLQIKISPEVVRECPNVESLNNYIIEKIENN